jgi:MoxR-like ATPase
MSLSPAEIETRAETFREVFTDLRSQIRRVFVGSVDLVDQLLIAFLCRGHVLLEGSPGVGKTLLVRTLGDALNLKHTRIQCTPDLMPADITGTNLLVETPGGSRSFTFQPGPIFANLVLADELNRATPRTQAAFLEAMQERHVTVFGVTHRLEDPFAVIATQNPIEMEGTYPLPEAQLDRFFFKVIVGMPGVDDLAEIMARTTGTEVPHATRTFGAATVREMGDLIKEVAVAEPAMRLALNLVLATHPDTPDAPPAVKKYVRFGASPRAAQAIILASKARALLAGRYHVATEDVRQAVMPALNHRIIRNFHGEMEQVSAAAIVKTVLDATGEQ